MKPVITTNGQYKNIKLEQMEDGESIVVEKIFIEGKPIRSKFQVHGKPEVFNYSCKVNYDGEPVAFFLNTEDAHNRYKAIGEVGDKIVITAKEEKYLDYKGKKAVRTLFDFKLL